MTDYSSITLLISLLMVAMTVHVLRYPGFNKKQKFWFVATFISITICAGAEFLVHGIPYRDSYKIPLTIVTVIQFSLSPVLAMFFAGALGLRYQDKVAIGFFGAGLVTEIVCAIFGAVFEFTDAGYKRGDFFIIYIIFYFASLLYMVAMLVVAGRRFRSRDITTIIAILVVLAAGVIPMTVFQLHVAYSAIGIASCLCYIYYNDLVQQDTQADLLAKKEEVSQMQDHIISGLASLIESRDTETGEHVARTSAIVKMLAEDCRAAGVYADVIDDHFITLLYTLAPMHDVGKIVVSDKILCKPGKLTPEEYEQMKKHASAGGEVVRKILAGITNEEYITFASDIATYHHERWDGKGYPEKISGEQIPLAARIMAVADVLDALVSKRVYKDPIPFDDAVAIIEGESGTHFDAKLIEVFLKNKEKYRLLYLPATSSQD